MFSAFQTFGRLGAGARAVAAAWTPAALWPTGTEPGMWIDPSNLDASWADSTGSTPVATPGSVADSSNPVGLVLDLRLGATVLTDLGNHLLQATSTARPLVSAYDGQTLGPGDTYDATGFPIFQKYDGTDDGMATATFTAGTLSNNMDCLIAVRRDSAVFPSVFGLYQLDQTKFFGVVAEEPTSAAVASGNCGSPTVFVDGVSVANTRGALHSAIGVGDWHILEYRDLDLSAWVNAGYGSYGVPYMVNGAQGGILLFPSSTPAADRDAARTWLGAKVGLTL